ncbi:MAG TPA: hypothetical protein VK858_05975 [Longimicrobiales bacterium]|nr:hypothetical protein [Longimicrobiales bacterium]
MFGSRPLRHRPAAQRIGILIVLLNLTACYTWQAADGPLPRVIDDDPPSRIRVTLEDGTEEQVHDPLIVGDTLYDRMRGRQPTAVAAVEDVRYVDVPKTDAVATTLAVVGLPALLLVGLTAIVCCDWSE